MCSAAPSCLGGQLHGKRAASASFWRPCRTRGGGRARRPVGDLAGADPLAHLYRTVVAPVAVEGTPGARYREWRVMRLAGTTLDVGDTAADRRAFSAAPRAPRARRRPAPFRNSGWSASSRPARIYRAGRSSARITRASSRSWRRSELRVGGLAGRTPGDLQSYDGGVLIPPSPAPSRTTAPRPRRRSPRAR